VLLVPPSTGEAELAGPTETILGAVLLGLDRRTRLRSSSSEGARATPAAAPTHSTGRGQTACLGDILGSSAWL